MNDLAATAYHGEMGGLQHLVPLPEIIHPDNFEREVELIFRRSWLPLVHDYDLPEKGSYIVVEMPLFTTSILVVRGTDERIRCFHNICRHRGNKLVRGGKGCKRGFTCGFHGWTYSASGALTGVTDEQQFVDLDKSKLGLVSINCDVWEGMVFVNFDPEPRQTLSEWMEVMSDEFGGYFSGREKIASHRIVANCNWHLGVNSFTEGYHTLYIHKNTVPDYQGGSANPDRHRPHMELMKRHTRYSAPANPDHVVSTVEGLAHKFGRTLFPAFDIDGSHLPVGVNPGKYNLWAFDVVELFPNFVMLNGAHWHLFMWFWPIDAGRTVIQMDMYAYKAATVGEKLGHAYFRARGREVFREDVNTLEAMQEMLQSGAMPHIVLSRQEMALQHHFKVAGEMMRAN
ncbi:MAG TPA: aromatic ring-hydroxylating dioxygenase subunit alpha [Methyloceanibacter sp.]|nr:aromatic ring-hydroxylating dioxygenase subunit alpha [Methyloceanibacter sp.]